MSSKKILVTGVNGQLGRAIRKAYEGTCDIIGTDAIELEGSSVLDITNLDAVIDMVRETKPDSIINCAAITNVDGCETAEDVAYKVNSIGPRNLAIAASETGAKIIHISTDYVFAGNATKPYTEFDKPSPVSAYGRTKLAGENLVKEMSNRFFILRTAWLYGDGKNFVKTMINAAATHDEVSVVMDQLGTPTSADELAKMIVFLENTDSFGTYHATCEGYTNWADFTEEIYRLKGIKTKVNHITSDDYKKINPASANRPAYGILDNMMLRLTTDKFMMADWHDAIKCYLK